MPGEIELWILGLAAEPPEIVCKLYLHGVPSMRVFSCWRSQVPNKKGCDMARAMSVKVPTAKVIAALEVRLVKTQTEWDTRGADEAKYQEEYKAWEVKMKKWALSRISDAENIRANYRSWANSVNLDFDVKTDDNFPIQPERNYETRAEWQVKSEVEEITNALNILKMTDEEYVNASTMKSISHYL